MNPFALIFTAQHILKLLSLICVQNMCIVTCVLLSRKNKRIVLLSKRFGIAVPVLVIRKI